MNKTRYFKLKPHVGLDPDGTPQPLNNIGVKIGVPHIIKNNKGEDVMKWRQETVTVKPMTKDSRIVEVTDPHIAKGILDSGHCIEIDKPSDKKLKSEGA